MRGERFPRLFISHDHIVLSQSGLTFHDFYGVVAAIKSYMNYAAARDVSLQQFAFVIDKVPFYREPKKQQPIIENTDSLAAVLAMPRNTHKGLRDKVMMSILYDSAIRAEELITINLNYSRAYSSCPANL